MKTKLFLLAMCIFSLGACFADSFPYIDRNDAEAIRQHELPDPRVTTGEVDYTYPDGAGGPYNPMLCRAASTLKLKNDNEMPFCKQIGGCEVDLLVPLELGGTLSPSNIWFQPLKGVTWEAASKDRLEAELYKQVCTGRLTLQQAQGRLTENWIFAYCNTFPKDKRCPWNQ